MSEKVNHERFTELMERLARAWTKQDTEAAIACFVPDAVYMQPPDIQLYSGHEQLRAYFGALKPGTYLRYQNLWFDETRQIGCAEFSFGGEGKPKADHGAFIVQLRDGLIAHWREYVQKGPADFQEFIASDGKAWQWHIGNYP
jgi:ketosteroid isomerase-like protein